MIGIDTNVLVRIFARDDEVQRRQAIRLIERLPSGVQCYVNWIVVVELIWTLRKAFQFDSQELAMVARQLTEHPKMNVPDKNILREAAHQARETGADLPDMLIRLINTAVGATETFTFDVDAARRAGMHRVPSAG
jgi:predicted nucleic-acid-binding protein